MSVDPARHQPRPWGYPPQSPGPQYAAAQPPRAYPHPPQPAAPPVPRPRFFSHDDGTDGIGRALATSFVMIYAFVMVTVLAPALIKQNVERSAAGAESEATKLAADGHSSLPVGHASLSYTPASVQSEWLRETNESGQYAATEWWVSCACSDDYMMLAHYTHDPPINSRGKLQDALAGAQAQAQSDADELVHFSTLNVGFHEAFAFRYRNHDDRQVLRVWVFGPVNSYRFECNTANTDSDAYRQCELALASLRIDD